MLRKRQWLSYDKIPVAKLVERKLEKKLQLAPKIVTRLRYKASGLSQSLKYAIAGIYFMLRTQRNMRVHVILGVSAFGLGIWLGISALELAAITIVASLVVICEMFNTAVENAVDLATHRRHPLAKAAKDVSAAAVLASALTAMVVGILLLAPKLFFRLEALLGP